MKSALMILCAVPLLATEARAQGEKINWERRLLQAVRPTPAGVRYDLVTTETPVEAATREEFVRKVSVAGARMLEGTGSSARSPGSYQYRITWQWELETHLGSCQMKDLNIKVNFFSDFAKPAGALAQDSAAMAWWAAERERQFEGRVEVLKALRDGAKGMHQKMRMINGSRCDDLSQRAGEMGRMLVLEVYENAAKVASGRSAAVPNAPVVPPGR